MCAVHGGNIIQAAARIGCRPTDMVDMSSNLNPLGPPTGLMDHLKEKITEACRLPDVDALSCSTAYAQQYGMEPGTVLTANGTTQFIYELPRAMDTRRALIIGPTYSDYARACRLHGITAFIWRASAKHLFKPDLERAVSTHRAIDTMFVCNPNNPTGRLVPGDELLSFCRRHPRVRVIVDESYLPFAAHARRHSLLLAQTDNLVVLSSFSKIFQIPGLRIGFASGAPALIDRLKAFQLPWNVNALAQAAVLYLLGRTDEMTSFIRKSRDYIEAQKRRWLPMLDAVSGLRIFSGPTPFVLVELPRKRSASSVVEHLLKQRLLIRDCANFDGLSSRYIRFSIKSERDNERFIGALSRFLTHERERRKCLEING